MDWRKYGVQIGNKTVFSEYAVSTLIEMLIDDSYELGVPELKAKWLGETRNESMMSDEAEYARSAEEQQ